MNKTHYRKVFKSDHLGIVDLEEYTENGSNLIYTIARVEQRYGERVAGKKIDCNVAYFVEKIKPLVLNATNSKTLRSLTQSPFVEDWQNVPVQLYIDKNVRMKGEVVGGVRISPQKPKVLVNLTPDHEQWQMAVNKVKNGMTRAELNSFFTVSDQVWGQLCELSK